MKDIAQDPAAMQALQTLKNLGFTEAEIRQAWDALPPTVLHLFQDDENHTYAANDIAHAKRLWMADTGNDAEDADDAGWTALDDSTMLTVEDEETKERQTKTAAEWVKEYNRPGYCFGGPV